MILFPDVNLKKECLPGNKHNSNLKLTGNKGSLKSPMKYYPPNLKCRWLITVPEGRIVELTFKRFELDKGFFGNNKTCPTEYVEILNDSRVDNWDKPWNRTEWGSKFCGSYYNKDKVPKPVRSSGRYMTVIFRSDSYDYTKFTGFEATFKAVDVNSK